MRWYEELLRSYVQHYNHEKYWQLRERVINPEMRYPKLLKLWWLFKIKRSDAFNNASTGANINDGAKFKTIPELPHGLCGIFISTNSIIGANCRIYQQVTIGEGKGGAPVIGDNCFIGAGAKIVGNIRIGNNVKIGANCVVVEDIPDNATVVLGKSRVICQEEKV